MSDGSLFRLTGEAAPPEPVLVVVLDGWIDAGLAATTALTALSESIELAPYAVFDGEELIDQRARRPRLEIEDGVLTGLSFPEPIVRVGRDRLGSGIAVLSGPEPDFRWRHFAAGVVELAQGMGVRLLVGFGGFPAPAPHTRPIRLASTASSEQLAQQVGFVPGSIEVPAGVQAVLEQAAAEAGIPAVGLWARVPHYVSAMPFPAAGTALLDGLASVSGLVIDTQMLDEAAEAARLKVDELIAASAEHAAMVRKLELVIDEAEGPGVGIGPGQMPTGDEIAAELERFLRGESGES
jgi:hypothetical protein